VIRRPLAAALVVLMLTLAACGASTPPNAAPTASAGPGASQAAAVPSDPATASGAVPALDGILPPGLLDAIADPSLEAISAAEHDARAQLDERIGLTTLIGPELQSWVQEQRSEAVKSALEANGIDTSVLGPSVISTQPMAALGSARTAEGVAWFGSGMAVSGLVASGLNHLGASQYGAAAPPTQSQSETTRGDRHTVNTITTQLRLTVSGSMIVADADITETDVTNSVSSGASLGNATTRSHIHVEAQMCPDANGGVTITITADMSGSSSPGGAATSTTTTGTRQITVGDDANVASDSETLDSTFDETPAGGARRTGTATLTAGAGSAPTFTSSGDYTPAEAGALQGMSGIVLRGVSTVVLGYARDAWQGSKCVAVKATESSRTVTPNEVITFTAQPHHLIEGVDLDKPVVAMFFGEASLDPVDTPVDAPASFTFKAAPTEKAGKVVLTSTSNRGIGTLEITFTVNFKGWFIDQAFSNAAGVSGKIEGKYCGTDPEGTWEAKGTYEFLVFKGKQLWTITFDDHSTTANGVTYTGKYKYRDDSTGPYGVKQHTRVSGTVSMEISDADGSATMKFTERSRHQTAEAPNRGSGVGPNTPQPVTDMQWNNATNC
jgi:hypothetical protein